MRCNFLVRRTEEADDQSPPGTKTPHIIAVQQGNVLATSFHPEVTNDRRIHRYFLDLVRAA